MGEYGDEEMCDWMDEGVNRALRVLEKDVQIVTTAAHSSIYKTAGILGIGVGQIIDVTDAADPGKVKFDFEKLRQVLGLHDMLSIVVVSCGEVNTGRFATTREDMAKLRRICDCYGAWLHIDAGKCSFASPA